MFQQYILSWSTNFNFNQTDKTGHLFRFAWYLVYNDVVVKGEKWDWISISQEPTGNLGNHVLVATNWKHQRNKHCEQYIKIYET